jgi:hypothetical protein
MHFQPIVVSLRDPVNLLTDAVGYKAMSTSLRNHNCVCLKNGRPPMDKSVSKIYMQKLMFIIDDPNADRSCVSK